MLRVALDPDPDRARRLLEQELSAPKYRSGLLQRALDWVGDHLTGTDGTGNLLGALGRPVLLVVLLVLVVGVAVLLSGLRRDPRVGTAARTVFDDVRRSAEEHRALARAALADDDFDTAVVEGLRALTAGLVERQVVADAPAATAREVAEVAAPRYPALAGRLAEAARLFDETRYGGRRADRARAETVLGVEDDVRRTSPSGATSGPVLAVPR